MRLLTIERLQLYSLLTSFFNWFSFCILPHKGLSTFTQTSRKTTSYLTTDLRFPQTTRTLTLDLTITISIYFFTHLSRIIFANKYLNLKSLIKCSETRFLVIKKKRNVWKSRYSFSSDNKDCLWFSQPDSWVNIAWYYQKNPTCTRSVLKTIFEINSQ